MAAAGLGGGRGGILIKLTLIVLIWPHFIDQPHTAELSPRGRGAARGGGLPTGFRHPQWGSVCPLGGCSEEGFCPQGMPTHEGQSAEGGGLPTAGACPGLMFTLWGSAHCAQGHSPAAPRALDSTPSHPAPGVPPAPSHSHSHQRHCGKEEPESRFFLRFFWFSFSVTKLFPSTPRPPVAAHCVPPHRDLHRAPVQHRFHALG